MAAVAVLSTQLVHHYFVKRQPEADAPPHIRTVVDRVAVPSGVS
jgi:hypothetical protein